MGWAKLDDRRHENPKLRQAGLAAAGLDSFALTYVSANETDGFLHETVVSMLANCHGWRKIATKLAEVGRWTRDDELCGWWIVNYLEFNPSHQELEEKRAAESERKRRAANARWGKKDEKKDDADGMHPASSVHEEVNGPDPTRPHKKRASTPAQDLVREWAESVDPPRRPNWAAATKVINGFLSDGWKPAEVAEALTSCDAISAGWLDPRLRALRKPKKSPFTVNGL